MEVNVIQHTFILYSVQFLEFVISIDVPSYILEAS